VAGVAGLTLAAAAGWWLGLVGVACLAAGWAYTGGPRPYGYLGLGEVFVFVFFGLVVTVGTAYAQLGRVTGLALVAAVQVGLLAVARPGALLALLALPAAVVPLRVVASGAAGLALVPALVATGRLQLLCGALLALGLLL